PAGHPETLLVTAQFDLSRFDERLYASCQLPSPVHLNRAVRKRRAEYLASRVVVRYALARMGIEGVILSNDPDRAPVWPAGISGSLSHSHQRIAVLLSRRENRLLSGVDCEQVMRPETAEEMQSRIVTAEEKRKLLESGLPFATALTLAFSVKESLYKALFPPLRQYMDFSAAEITALFPATGKVQLRLTTSFSSDFPAGREFTGQVELEADQVLSWVIEG
ncbi:4'-phosphopantetheinyl transferase family protein, partial [Erwinia sp.]|uniref:4'-phosphopantetheinyl transferase family protein n=1 Tax=Erwinia citreus TaxID=558 RepID=UPI003C78243D